MFLTSNSPTINITYGNMKKTWSSQGSWFHNQKRKHAFCIIPNEIHVTNTISGQSIVFGKWFRIPYKKDIKSLQSIHKPNTLTRITFKTYAKISSNLLLVDRFIDNYCLIFLLI